MGGHVLVKAMVLQREGRPGCRDNARCVDHRERKQEEEQWHDREDVDRDDDAHPRLQRPYLLRRLVKRIERLERRLNPGEHVWYAG